jgi:transcriptional regulator with XRE-family HTH domain
MKAREIIGLNLQRLRRERQWSQEDLASEADIDRRHVGRIENGRANVTVDVLEKLAKALRVSLADLSVPISGSSSKSSPNKTRRRVHLRKSARR